MSLTTANSERSGDRTFGFMIVRLVFGAWFLFSGAEYFSPFDLQPLGNTPLAKEFTLALIHSGLFAWIKAMEIVIGVLLLINRAILPAALATAPLTVVIAYWNFVLDPGVVEYLFGAATVACNAVLLWPYRSELIALLRWRD
jgi:uncharacterized membrane protein YphA (DoxX/SURF4 family)